MLNVCIIATNESADIEAVRTRMLASKTSIFDRISWCGYVLVRGRRRLTDRLVLCVAAALGYLWECRRRSISKPLALANSAPTVFKTIIESDHSPQDST